MEPYIRMNVETKKQYGDALAISQNGMFERTEILVQNKNRSFSAPSDLAGQVQGGVQESFQLTGGTFAHAQLSRYSMNMLSDPFGRYCLAFIRAGYLCTGKEQNDLICYAAEIGELLRQKTACCQSDYEKVLVFDRWTKTHFHYKNRNLAEDHCAVHLLQSREGVCQALAALALKVLPFMGIRTMYVAGEGRGNQGWGGHAWNVVRLNHRWVHVDFTFSLHSFWLPSTHTSPETAMFRRFHRWDSDLYGEPSLNARLSRQEELISGELVLIPGSKSGFLRGVQVKTEAPLLKRENGRQWVDIMTIVRMLGGGCEIIGPQDTMFICLRGKRFKVSPISPLQTGRYIDASILGQIGNVAEAANGVKIFRTCR